MSALVLVRVVEWASVILGLLGIALGAWFARDNWLDLRAYRARGWNGFAELAGAIGMRSGISKAVLHTLLEPLPLVGLTTTPRNVSIAVLFFAPLALGQAVVIVAQVLNQRDRTRLRRKLGEQ